MDFFLYWLALGLVRFLQALPLRWAARLGRWGGGLAYWLDGRHRRVAIDNLTRCFGAEKSAREILGLARENFKRLGESYACGIKTAGMTWRELQPHLTLAGLEKLRQSEERESVGEATDVRTLRGSDAQRSDAPTSRIIAIGHFGNFELYARANPLFPGYHFATTYRALKQPALNQLLVRLRTASGCLVFERRRESDALRAAMSSQPLVLGLLSDQHAGAGGVRIPFFGELASTTTAPAVFAMRYKAPLNTAICYRTGLAQWRIEVGDEIPAEKDGRRRSSTEIMLDVNAAFEAAIRRDPANWFWVHKRWKPGPSKVQSPTSKVETPAADLAK